jgi:hypothetical protein
MACVLVLGGCGAPAADTVRSSGALLEGFEIEPGSAVIGTVLPTPHPYGGTGRQAFLRVDGDVRIAFEGYGRQADELGFSIDLPRTADGRWCRVPFDGTTDGRPPERLTTCSTHGSRPDGAELRLDGYAEADGQGYVRLSVTSSSDDPLPLPPVPDGPAARVTDADLSGLASTTDDPPVRLVEGSALVLDPIGVCEGCGSYLALLRVTGELAPVLRGYEEQFRRAGFTSPEGLTGEDDELIIGSESAGGGYLTAVGAAGEPSYVLIERIYD